MMKWIEGIIWDDFQLCVQLCGEINKQEGIVELYSCSTTDNDVGYLHQGALEVRSSPLVASNNLAISLATVTHKSSTYALVTCSFAALPSQVGDDPSTLIPQLIKAIMDLSLTERILCLADFSHLNHASCKYSILKWVVRSFKYE